MFGKPMVLSQLWRGRVPYHATLYAFSFWSSSYTLMATVCRFSPSHFLGFFSAGLRSCKEGTSLSYYVESQLGLSLGRWRGGESVPHSLEAILCMFSKRAGTLARFRGIRCSTWGCSTWGFAVPPDSVLGPCPTDPCYRPKIEGYEYVGKSLFS
jgi:hypothetical protein